MKLNREQYNELVEKLADELVQGVMEKTAGSVVDYVKGNRDFSKGEDQKTRIWKDRVGGEIPSGAAAYALSQPIVNSPAYKKEVNEAVGQMLAGDMKGAMKKSLLSKPALAVSGVSAGVTGAVDTARGKSLAKNNDVKWTAGDTVKSTLLPYVTPDSIVKRKVREKSAVKEAAEALIEAVMYKEAACTQMEEAGLVAEASELALNAIGYSMEA